MAGNRPAPDGVSRGGGTSAGVSSFLRRNRGDILLIAVLLLVAGAVLLTMLLTRVEGSYVRVTREGEEIGRFSLSVDGEYSLNGGTHTLVIEQGRAYMLDADCPDRVCVHTGRISYVGQSIVCLPYDVTVIIEGEGGVDFVS